MIVSVTSQDFLWHFLWASMFEDITMEKMHLSSVESQKGVIVKFSMFRWEPEGRCHCTKSMATTPFWFSTEHHWIVLTPFLFSLTLLCRIKGMYVNCKKEKENKESKKKKKKARLGYFSGHAHVYCITKKKCNANSMQSLSGIYIVSLNDRVLYIDLYIDDVRPV